MNLFSKFTTPYVMVRHAELQGLKFTAKNTNRLENKDLTLYAYHNDPTGLGKHCRPRSDCCFRSKKQSDQDLHCLPFCLHFLDALLSGKQYCSNFRIITVVGLDARFFHIFNDNLFSGII